VRGGGRAEDGEADGSEAGVGGGEFFCSAVEAKELREVHAGVGEVAEGGGELARGKSLGRAEVCVPVFACW